MASADDEELRRLERLVTQLNEGDEATRRRAYEQLTHLNEDALPAIRARIERLQRHRPPENWVDDIIHRFRRRANGDPGESDDPAAGALEELGEEHRDGERQMVMQMAEPLMLWRSLERMGTLEAHRAALPLVALDDGAWLPEARNWVRRAEADVMACAIEARTHDHRLVRRWARWAMEHLQADEPGRAVQRLDDSQLADVLRAYAVFRLQSAMRVIVSYVDSERRGVRRAARWAMERYGGNAIWILRTAYRNETGEHAPREWGWRRLSEELYERVDARRLAAVRAALDEGLAARERGELETMGARFDEVLARAPDLEEPGPVAEGYAALADARMAEGRAEEAALALRRALRLAPEHEHATRWRSLVTFAQAERRRARGVLDPSAYREVLEVLPEHGGAAAALRLARPPAAVAATAGAPPRRRWGLIAATLMALLGVGLVWGGRGRDAPIEERELDDTAEDDTAEDDTLAGDDRTVHGPSFFAAASSPGTLAAATTSPGTLAAATSSPGSLAAPDEADRTWTD